MEFHVHIYYDTRSRASAVRMREGFIARGTPGLTVGPMHDQLRGPHSLPMFELGFESALLTDILTWLLLRRGDHAVLIHAVTGNDPVDHDRHAFWLGDPLWLDRSKLDPPQVGWREVQPTY